MKYSQKDLQSKIKRIILENQLISSGDRIVVALSGGPDSVCLLHILSVLKDELKFELSACHYNHLMRGQESHRDEKFVQKLAELYDIEMRVERASRDIKSEDQARVARYDFFNQLIKDGFADKIAIAHNANDVAETYLMRIIRGTGLRGLQSIPIIRGKYIRPLLEIERKEIEGYLEKNSLASIVDSTNLLFDYQRNKVRLSLLPALSEFNPQIVSTLAMQAKIIKDDYDFVTSCAEEIIRYQSIKNNEKIIFPAKAWSKLHPSMQMMVLRLMISSLNPELIDITYKQLVEVVNLVKKGEGNKFKVLPSSLKIQLLDGKIIISIN